jgi:hypothetical protein
MGLAALAGGTRASATPGITIGPASSAPTWTALFDRTSGWTGADGIYSTPLSGYDGPGPTAQTRTLFTFDDTFIGSVNPDGSRAAGSQLIHNTYGTMQGGDPTTSSPQFTWNTGHGGSPQPVWVPNTPNTEPGDWYWPNDAVVANGKVNLFALRENIGTGGAFNFTTEGVSLLTWPVGDANPGSDATQVDSPLFLAATKTRGEINYGGAIMANTNAAGAPFPDGYIYVYGVQNDPSTKQLLVARTLPANIANFSKYQFWTGTTWSSSVQDAAPVTSRISEEFSVTPLTNGQYILIFQLDDLSNNTAYRLGSSPTGPWGSPVTIWTCAEASEYPSAYCYNAKAHPHLSQPGQLLISYNVNTFSFAANMQYAEIYHPRFITLPVSAFGQPG